MINLEKIKQEKCQSPPPFRKTCPCTILSLPFLIFQIPLFSSRRDNQNLLPPFKKRGERSKPSHFLLDQCDNKKKPSQLSVLVLNLNFIHPCLALIYIYIILYSLL